MVKKFLKRAPFFSEINYLRRKVYDSRLFDFTVKTLADKLTDWPRSLVLDITNRCNAKCIWCPNDEITNVGTMDMDLFIKIINNFAGRGGYIYLGTFGEPLMDKMFVKRIEFIRRYRSIQKIQILTNAFFLDENIISLLIDNSVRVEISLDEVDKETFERVKKMSYDVVSRNIINFLEANDRAKNPVQIHFRIKTLKSVKETLDHEFFKIIIGHKCTFDLNSVNENIISNWAGEFDKNNFFNKFAQNSKSSKYSHKRFNLANKAPCHQLWERMHIYWDGNVIPCCADMFSRFVVGNLRNNSIEEIWRGPVMMNLREKMVRRERFEISLCKNCDIHLSWHYLKRYNNFNGESLPQ